LTYISQFDLLERATVKQVRKKWAHCSIPGGCNRATALRMYQGARPFGHSTWVGWIRGVFGVIWGCLG